MHRNTVHADLRRLAAMGAIRLDCDRAQAIDSVHEIGLVELVRNTEAARTQFGPFVQNRMEPAGRGEKSVPARMVDVVKCIRSLLLKPCMRM